MITLCTRTSGVLLHPTSLPGPYGIGSLGAHARAFVDFLSDSEQRFWQILPLGPTGFGNSPYACLSTFAGNPVMIDLDELAHQRLLTEQELTGASGPGTNGSRVDFAAVHSFKTPLLQHASRMFSARASAALKATFDTFCHEQAWWLDDYVLFEAAKLSQNQRSLREWDSDLRTRKPSALAKVRENYAATMHEHRVMQFLFFHQWKQLRAYAAQKHVRIIGDMPIFVAFDSDAVWSTPHLFKLDETLAPPVVAGVPPDYFSATGQLWGNPLYEWQRHEKDGFQWWLDRLKMALDLADVVRLDHFRGFEAAWEVASHHTDAREGMWVPGPGNAFFDAILKRFGKLPLIAEDLGIITDEVRALRDKYELPGMHVLQFGFPEHGPRTYAPHHATANMVVYTGTHDNDTTLGWFAGLPENERNIVRDYLNTTADTVHWDMIRAAYATVANTVIIPMQDILGLGTEARMNLPGTVGNCWDYRMQQAPSDTIRRKLARLTDLFERRGQAD